MSIIDKIAPLGREWKESDLFNHMYVVNNKILAVKIRDDFFTVKEVNKDDRPTSVSISLVHSHRSMKVSSIAFVNINDNSIPLIALLSNSDVPFICSKKFSEGSREKWSSLLDSLRQQFSLFKKLTGIMH